MSEINQITVGSTTYDIQSSGILYGEVDSTSTSTAFTATINGLNAYYDGVCILLKNGVVTSASGFTIDINNLGAKPVYSSMATGNDITPTDPTRETTLFNINYSLLLIYSSTLVDGGAWINYRGYNSNDNTLGYQLRTNSTVMVTSDQSRYYRLFFTSADGTQMVPANTAKDNSATSVKTVNQRPIDPFGRIIYYSYTTNLSAGSNLGETYCWDQYGFTLGYSFNTTGSALTLTTKTPVYIKCAPQSDGSAIIDSTTPYVQALPTTADGKIYIFLGIAYSETQVELQPIHPVYYYSNGAIRLWTNNLSAVTSVNGQTGDITLAIPSNAADVNAYGIFTDQAELAADVKVFTKDQSGTFYWGTATSTPSSYKIAKYNSGYLKSTTPSSDDNSTKVATTAFVTAAVPTNVSAFTNDAGYLTSYTETDPTVPSWAKTSSKPTYTASEVGAVPTSRTINGYALSSDVTLTANDVGAWPNQANTLIGSDLDSYIILARWNTDPTSYYITEASSSPRVGSVAKYGSGDCLYSTTPSATDSSTKVATTAYVQAALASAGGASEWGQLTGTLSNQTDLQAALDSKVAKSGDTMSGNLSVSKTTAPEILVKDSTNNNLAASLLVGSGHQNHGLYSNGYAPASDTFTSDSKWIIYRGSDGEAHSELKIFGAVWNDYAEYRKTIDVKPGTCVHEKGDGSLEPSSDFLQYGCEIISDTYGFAIGENDECKTPIAVSGRVLAYLYQDREEALKHIGWPVCSGPNGTVSIMSEEEQRLYPLRAIGTISEVPNYEYWGTGNVKVDGRVWIRLR